jgi:hypothetical protein
MIQLSTPALAGKIETFSQRKGKWSKSSLAPQDAAVTSIALFGMELARGGQTPNERLAGSTLQMALIDYAKQNPSASLIPSFFHQRLAGCTSRHLDTSKNAKFSVVRRGHGPDCRAAAAAGADFGGIRG